MWSFFADAGIALLLSGAVSGAASLDAEGTDPSQRLGGETLRAAFATESLLESGSLEEMASARDRASAIATEARERHLGSGNPIPTALPDSDAFGWIDLVTSAHARALRQESVRLDRGGAADGSFRSLWSAMVRAHLEILERWPRLWREEGVGGTPAGSLPARLLLLCSPEAYAGESFELPRENLFLRMATLPESLLACCIESGMLHRAQGAPGLDQLAADIARNADLDALVGFRHGRRYWTLRTDAPPRSRSNDAAVARAESRVALEMLQACAEIQFERPGSSAANLKPAALADLRAQGKLWPPDADPFESVPGLRNPRRDPEGRLVCDLAMAEACLAAMHPTARARLVGRLAPGARLIPMRADTLE